MPGSTTNFGWPKPLATDLIAQGADTIGTALDRIDGQLMVPADTYTADAAFTSWPLGISIMLVAGTTGNWPANLPGQVITYRQSGRGNQFYMTTAPTSLYWRWYGATPGPWIQIAGGTVPTAFATGGVANATVTPNVLNQIPVTFPANRFATTPRLSLTLNVTNPQNWFMGFSPISTTGFTVTCFHPTATAVSFHWIAALGAT
jgi:hypothetical protein